MIIKEALSTIIKQIRTIWDNNKKTHIKKKEKKTRKKKS